MGCLLVGIGIHAQSTRLPATLFRLTAAIGEKLKSSLSLLALGANLCRYAERPQRIENHCHVDHLLEQSTLDRRKIAERGRYHRKQRERQSGENALEGDAPGALRNQEGGGQAGQVVD